MIIVLLGYMGCGKSTIGQQLADNMGCSFLDLDDFIEAHQKLSISELFKIKGEVQFRAIERRAVETVCRSHDNLVLALGGGTPCYSNTMTFLVEHPNVQTVYLKSSIQTLYNRLVNEKSKRPLIEHISDEKLTEFIAKHVFERSKFYNQAQLVVLSDNNSVKAIATEILRELN